MIRKILLVDDDSDDRELFAEAMEAINPEISCNCAASMDEGMAQLMKNQANLPDLIFLDINMPIKSGWDFLNSIKSNDALQHIPVIMYSTSSHDVDKKTAMELGAKGFMTKPSNYRDLNLLLKEVIDGIHTAHHT